MTDRFTGTTPNPVHVGGSLYVKYTNPERAGETISVTIVDTGRGRTETVNLVLDDAGVGSTPWPVPMDWGPFATLEGPDSEDHLVLVTGSGKLLEFDDHDVEQLRANVRAVAEKHNVCTAAAYADAADEVGKLLAKVVIRNLVEHYTKTAS